MRSGRSIRLAAALALALPMAMGAAGCIEEPEVITCENFDTYLSICYFTCVAGWECEYNYRAVEADLQHTLDFCSECLAEEAELSCHDCIAPTGDSCQALLVQELALTCDW